MRKLFTLFLACTFIYSVSQNATYSVQLFYSINASFSAKNFERLDSFCKALPVKPAKITITGYADFLYSDNYNLNLSHKRANLVKDYLLQGQNAAQLTILNCKGMGEAASVSNNSKEGEPGQRRVDVIVEIQAPVGAPVITTKKKPEVTKYTEQKISPAVKLEELKEGESFELEGLSFEPGRHFLLKGSWPVLKKLLETLKNNPAIKIEIQGHICCSEGSNDSYDYDARNSKLSENRAKSVYDYLVKNGIDEDRLTFKGYGHSMPKVKETGPEEEQMNRRVEVQVIEN